MNDEKSKPKRETPVETDKADRAAIVDKGWSKVDIHDNEKTPEADLPSDIEPDGA